MMHDHSNWAPGRPTTDENPRRRRKPTTKTGTKTETKTETKAKTKKTEKPRAHLQPSFHSMPTSSPSSPVVPAVIVCRH